LTYMKCRAMAAASDVAVEPLLVGRTEVEGQWTMITLLFDDRAHQF
jgi:hypothetical protein